MNLLRKFELSGGAITAVIGIFVGFTYIRLDQKASERLNESPVSSVMILSLVYLFPAVLVLLGSLLHSVKRKQLGQFLLIIGSLVNMVIFILFLFSPVPVPYARIDLFWLGFLSAALAIGTSAISFLVQRQR